MEVELGVFEKELPARQGLYRAQRLASTLLRSKSPGTNLQLGPFQWSSSLGSLYQIRASTHLDMWLRKMGERLMRKSLDASFAPSQKLTPTN